MKIICVSGKARAGKDTSANIFKKILSEQGNKVLIAHYADLVKYICKTFFNWNGEKDKRGRTLLQTVGTECVRSKKENYWVDFIIDILNFFPESWDYVIIPDCRFPNEVDRLKERGFDSTLVKVVRPNYESDLTDEQKKHSSETALDNYRADYIIENAGDIQQLAVEVHNILENIQKRGE